MKVRTVVFDLDGTLVNSLDCYYRVFCEVFSRFSLPLVDRASLIKLMGAGQNIVEQLIPSDWPERNSTKQRCTTLFRDIWTERYATGIELYPEVVPTVRDLSERGFQLGIATAAQGDWIHGLLQTHDIAACFGAVVTYGEVPRRKPAPDLIVECLYRLGALPDRSVYVGDSPIDIIAAKAAGARSVGVLTGASDRASLKQVQPDLIIEYLGELPAALEKES